MKLPTNNAGLRRLVALVDRLTTAGMKGICPAFDLWHERRWKTIEEGLDLWCRDPMTNKFIDKYAASLADDLADLRNKGYMPAVTVAAAMDMMEELFAQARDFHAAVNPATNPETSASSASSALNQVKP